MWNVCATKLSSGQLLFEMSAQLSCPGQLLGSCGRTQLLGVVTAYSEWGMRGWSVLGSVPLMGFGVFGWSPLMARCLRSKLIMHYFLFL